MGAGWEPQESTVTTTWNLRALGVASLCALASLLWGCLEEDPNGPSGPRIEVGTGATRFDALPVTLPDGGIPSVEIVFGPQGGYHIWGAIRAHEMAKDVKVVYTLKDVESGELISTNDYELSLTPNGDALEWPGMLGLVPTPGAINGKLIEMGMEATDADGTTRRDARQVTAILP
jgi:hypothetical protein